MNVGFSDDWKYSERTSLHRKKRRAAARSAGGMSAKAGEETSYSGMSRIIEDEHEDARSVSTRHLNVGATGTTGADVGVAGADAGVAGSLEHSDDDAEKGSEDDGAVIATGKSSYPWHKPSVDKLVRVQLYSYRQYDGVVGLIQRKIKGWPTIAKYSDKYVLLVLLVHMWCLYYIYIFFFYFFICLRVW